jgi:hypothetical protein
VPAEARPASFRSGGIHLAVALVVGTILGPVLHVVPGLPSALSLFVALFAVGLPAITYMCSSECGWCSWRPDRFQRRAADLVAGSTTTDLAAATGPPVVGDPVNPRQVLQSSTA